MLAGTGTHAQMIAPPPSTAAVAAIRSEVKADVAQVKANTKTSAITREQIQQLRTALQAKLSAMRK